MKKLGILAAGASLPGLLWGPPGRAQEVDRVRADEGRGSTTAIELKKLTIEELMEQEVISGLRRPQLITEAAAAIEVITAEDIRRSGVTTIPDALRLATGVHVARATGNSWSITARGFNAFSSSANKLQVLMDGRSLYSPLYSGVLWDVQHYLLEDIDRIEVVRGPGGTLWGANAFNGVINIVTKSAAATQGTLLTGGGGTEEQGFGGVRYGGKAGKNTYYRAYATYFNRDALTLSTGGKAPNAMMLGQTGFRTDTELNEWNSLTTQGDYYNGVFGTLRRRDSDVQGSNLLGRWKRTWSEEQDLTLQVYYDRTHRDIPTTIEDRQSFDFDSQHRFPLGERNSLMWGFNYRFTGDDIENPLAPGFAFLPTERNLHLFSGFIQDEVTLIEDRLALTVGSKLDHNDFSGFEIQPSGRLAYTPTERQTLWGAVSRAVRTPTRFDVDSQTLVRSARGSYFVLDDPNYEFQSEEVQAFELGYRLKLNRRVAFDVAAFYNLYDNIRTLEPITPPGTPLAVTPRNGISGDGFGLEFAQQIQPVDSWTLRASYTYLNLRLEADEGSRAGEAALPGPNRETSLEANDPRHMFTLRSTVDLPGNLEFDQVLRYVGALPNPSVPDYLVLDLRLAWQPRPGWEIAVVGQNLLDDKHPEYSEGRQVEQSIYGKVTWKF